LFKKENAAGSQPMGRTSSQIIDIFKGVVAKLKRTAPRARSPAPSAQITGDGSKLPDEHAEPVRDGDALQIQIYQPAFAFDETKRNV